MDCFVSPCHIIVCVQGGPLKPHLTGFTLGSSYICCNYFSLLGSDYYILEKCCSWDSFLSFCTIRFEFSFCKTVLPGWILIILAKNKIFQCEIALQWNNFISAGCSILKWNEIFSGNGRSKLTYHHVHSAGDICIITDTFDCFEIILVAENHLCWNNSTWNRRINATFLDTQSLKFHTVGAVVVLFLSALRVYVSTWNVITLCQSVRCWR